MTRDLSRLGASLAVALGVLGGAVGCVFTAHQLDPRPIIEGRRVPVGMRVDVAEAIPDALLVPGGDGISDLDVKGWRQALMLGMERGRPQRFAPPVEGEPAWQLVLEKAEPGLLAVDISPEGRAELFTAEIRYAARLYGPDLTLVREWSGRVEAAKPFQGVSDGSALLNDAISVLVHELIQAAAAVASAPLAAGRP